jgi:predicted nucleic acid-binding protein
VIVLDASIALAWCFADEQSPMADAVAALLSKEGAIVPAIWPLEIGNALLAAERRGRLAVAERPTLLRLLAAMPIEVEPIGLAQAVGPLTDLARTHHLSVYDAAYVDLAFRMHINLATLDRRLAEAASAVGIAPAVQRP